MKGTYDDFERHLETGMGCTAVKFRLHGTLLLIRRLQMALIHSV